MPVQLGQLVQQDRCAKGISHSISEPQQHYFHAPKKESLGPEVETKPMVEPKKSQDKTPTVSSGYLVTLLYLQDSRPVKFCNSDMIPTGSESPLLKASQISRVLSTSSRLSEGIKNPGCHAFNDSKALETPIQWQFVHQRFVYLSISLALVMGAVVTSSQGLFKVAERNQI